MNHKRTVIAHEDHEQSWLPLKSDSETVLPSMLGSEKFRRTRSERPHRGSRPDHFGSPFELNFQWCLPVDPASSPLPHEAPRRSGANFEISASTTGSETNPRNRSALFRAPIWATCLTSELKCE